MTHINNWLCGDPNNNKKPSRKDVCEIGACLSIRYFSRTAPV